MAIDDQVIRVISEELGISRGIISTKSDLISELGADESDMIAIMKATEYKFHIKISDENWSKMRTVRDIAHLVDVYLEIKQIEM